VKKRRESIICLFAVVACCHLGAFADPLTGVVESADGSEPSDYVPAMLSNGRLNVFCDYTLSTPGQKEAYVKKNLRPGIWWEGRRYGDNNGVASRFGYQFFPQGLLFTTLEANGKSLGAPTKWRQALDLKGAVSTVTADYAQGVRLEGEMFVPQAANVLALKQTVSSRDGGEVTVGVRFDAPSGERLVGSWKAEDGAAVWSMTAYARFVSHETITVRPADGSDCLVLLRGGSAHLVRTLRLEPGAPQTLTWYVVYADDLAAKLPAVTRAPANPAKLPDYDALRAAHVADWSAYFAESALDVPDARLRALSDMARYHLRCNRTEWSIPVGVIQSHWQGRIFAFDEMYGVQGLLSAGHFSTAKVAPDFRFATLRNACLRNNKNNNDPFYGVGARWVWEAAEGNDVESGPLGYWDDHIFHSAAVAQTVWTYYRYTDDLDYLKAKGYDVLRECALFFRRLYVQDMPDGTSFVTKCTDLERLGAGKDHAFMTTCGVIMTLRAAADAADLVGKDADLAKDFRACATRLVASLPEKDGRYIAYPSCTDESMGTLAGFFPFRTFDRSNATQVRSVRHFLENGEAFGNMYDTGKRICPWYAATMALAALRAGDDRYPPARWLTEAFRSAGCWGEYWEINEPGVSEYRPWFMTAAGNCLYAVNQLFVADMEGAVYLAAGVPKDWKDYAFRLPAPGGVEVDMAVKGGVLERLMLRVKNPKAGRSVRLVLPAALGGATVDAALDRAVVTVRP